MVLTVRGKSGETMGFSKSQGKSGETIGFFGKSGEMISFWGLVRGNNVLFRVQVRVKSIIKVSVFCLPLNALEFQSQRFSRTYLLVSYIRDRLLSPKKFIIVFSICFYCLRNKSQEKFNLFFFGFLLYFLTRLFYS